MKKVPLSKIIAILALFWIVLSFAWTWLLMLFPWEPVQREATKTLSDDALQELIDSANTWSLEEWINNLNIIEDNEWSIDLSQDEVMPDSTVE